MDPRDASMRCYDMICASAARAECYDDKMQEDERMIVNQDYNWVWLLPYLLRGKYDVAPIYALWGLFPYLLRDEYDVAPIFVWGKYGSSSTCYWESMVAPVLVTGQKSCERTGRSPVKEQAEVV
ncbi:hypothetical protein E3N88_28935 [Mikania micrantha]|uniref:Uncharacterized protein n=1 Tax=Mikania micrantha TaxID=192012 RepID=A0A5N6N2J9_9ASTR|nr:hypothetical protein E3N88_28935 [Mikania micrantha]